MPHYSEMSFLFEPTARERVNNNLNNTSANNTVNVIKGGSNYIVYKNGQGENSKVGTQEIKNYLKEKIYRDKSKNIYLKLIDDFNKKNGEASAGLRLKASDFAYLRELGVYPLNRMAILRRFPEGCMVPEHLDEMKLEPISTIVGWIKPDQNFGKIDFQENWTKTNRRFDVVLVDLIAQTTGGVVDVKKLVPIPDYAQGVLFEFYAGAGVVGANSPDSIDEDFESFSGDSTKSSGGGNWGLSNIPAGNPNVLQEGPFRDPVGQNITSNFTFELTTIYEQKLLGEVDPGSAMLDILDNIYAMGTSNMLFYWSNTSEKIMKPMKEAVEGQANEPIAWWKFVKGIIDGFWEEIKKLFENAKNEIEEVYEKAKEAANQDQEKRKALEEELKKEIKGKAKANIDKLINTILTSTIAIHRFELRGSLELMTGGMYSSTPWYLTLGNPYSPWLATNHIIVKNCTIETSTEMGFNDQPQYLTAKFTCELSRSLGKQELMRMFNNTYRRTYSEPVGNFTPMRLNRPDIANLLATPNISNSSEEKKIIKRR